MKAAIVVGTYERFLFGYEFDYEQLLAANFDEPQTSDPIFVHPVHLAAIKSVALNKKGLLVSGSGDETIHIYDVNKRKEFSQFFVESGVNQLAFAGPNLIAASASGRLTIWRTRDWSVLSDSRAHHKEVLSLSIHPSEAMALTVAADGGMKLWNLKDASAAFKRRLFGGIAVAWCPSGVQYATLHEKKTELVGKSQYVVTLWGVAQEEPIHSTVYDEAVTCSAFVCPGVLAIGFANGDMCVITPADGAVVHRREKAHPARIKAIVRVAPAEAPEGWLRTEAHADVPSALVDARAKLAAGALFATASSDGVINVWKVLVPAQAQAPGPVSAGSRKRENAQVGDKKKRKKDAVRSEAEVEAHMKAESEAAGEVKAEQGDAGAKVCGVVWSVATKGRVTCMCSQMLA